VTVLDGSAAAAVARAADLLAAGEIVAFPTETVYGLGARADDAAAVLKIFRVKGRPENHPLIVHVAEPALTAAFAAEVSPLAQRLIDAFWPGPLTLILPRVPAMAAAAAGHQNSIGLRCPSHPVARALLAAAHARGVPGVAAPSANRFGRTSPTRAAHVVDEFGDTLAVLDGGDADLGIESSIVDCSRGHPVLLRPGMLARARIEAVAGEPLRAVDAGAPRAPGMLAAHYAPNAKLRLMPTAMLHTALQVLGERPLKLAVYSRGPPPGAARGVLHRRMPAQAAAAAHELFSVLRELDAEGAQLIWVEEPPPEPEWDGVRDRLWRAAAA
jgi:L-threonylcarbamoyladenylate synthase